MTPATRPTWRVDLNERQIEALERLLDHSNGMGIGPKPTRSDQALLAELHIRLVEARYGMPVASRREAR